MNHLINNSMKNIIAITCLLFLSATLLQAQDIKPKEDNEQDNIKIELKGAPHPDIYIDGKKYDHEILELLDQSKIESINVLKDEKALKDYNAPNGVIIITTKKASQQNTEETKVQIRSQNNDKDPVIIIDGEVADKEVLSKLSPDKIESINVWKGEEATKKYSAPNGAIVVKTKKH